MSEVVTLILPLILPLSFGCIGGFIMGYAAKKVYRPAIIVGAFIFSVICLAYAKVISLNISELETVSTLIVAFAPSIIALLTSSLLFMGGFAVGLVSGLMKK